MRYFFIVFLLIFLAVFVHAQSDTLFNQIDSHNLKQGWWKKSYPNGKIMYKGYFKDNKPAGVMKRYYETGELKAVLNYDSRGEYAHASLLYADGQLAAEGRYFNSLKDSTWNYYSYYNHALTAREEYTKGLRNGLMQHFFSNGSPSEKLTWVNNKKEGPWEQFFANNGLKLKGFFHEGILHGDFLVNYESGKLYLKGSYQDDLREGLWIFYKEDGSVDMELTYHNGKTPNEDKLDDKQQELFHMIDENQGKFEEPDETNFLVPGGR
jgi:antitoxin component YwqK of YwqJK toxin-antitoxin module